jgi:hypothetical protein
MKTNNLHRFSHGVKSAWSSWLAILLVTMLLGMSFGGADAHTRRKNRSRIAQTMDPGRTMNHPLYLSPDIKMHVGDGAGNKKRSAQEAIFSALTGLCTIPAADPRTVPPSTFTHTTIANGS